MHCDQKLYKFMVCGHPFGFDNRKLRLWKISSFKNSMSMPSEGPFVRSCCVGLSAYAVFVWRSCRCLCVCARSYEWVACHSDADANAMLATNHISIPSTIQWMRLWMYCRNIVVCTMRHRTQTTASMHVLYMHIEMRMENRSSLCTTPHSGR